MLPPANTPRITWEPLAQILLRNLKGEVPPESRTYLDREEARDELKRLTGEDFGYDPAAWEAWLTEHVPEAESDGSK